MSRADGTGRAPGPQIEKSARQSFNILCLRLGVDFRDLSTIFEDTKWVHKNNIFSRSSHVWRHVWSFLATTSDFRYATVEACWEFANKGQRTRAGRPTTQCSTCVHICMRLEPDSSSCSCLPALEGTAVPCTCVCVCESVCLLVAGHTYHIERESTHSWTAKNTSRLTRVAAAESSEIKLRKRLVWIFVCIASASVPIFTRFRE